MLENAFKILQALRRKRPQLDLDHVILHHDNAPAHRPTTQKGKLACSSSIYCHTHRSARTWLH
jgi:hypothetical protein